MAEISLRRVAKSYGAAPVVHALDLDIASGEFVVILGPSGCGKSTLLRMIAGLEDLTSGELDIDGRRADRLEPRERGCAMVFQNYALYPHMTVGENIGYALKVAGLPRTERRERVAKVAEALGLVELLDRRPAQLSGGQRQRVAMGRAMIREPSVFLFDEPLSNLDAELRVRMRVEIRRLHDRLGATSIFVTHDQIEAMTLADRIVVLNTGRIEQVGTPSEIWSRPASCFVAGFIGSPPMNLLAAVIDENGEIRLTDGTGLASPVGGLAAGRRLTLGIRPEDVRIAEAPDVENAVRMSVTFTERLGATTLLHGRLGDCDVVVSGPPWFADGAPEALALEIETSTLHVFDAETGLRMDTAALRAGATGHRSASVGEPSIGPLMEIAARPAWEDTLVD